MDNQHQHISRYIETLDFGGYGIGRTICNTKDGGYLLAGDTVQMEAVSDNFIYAPNYSRICVAKINNKFQIEWTKTFGDFDFYKCEAVVESRDGGFVLTGWTNSKNGIFSIDRENTPLDLDEYFNNNVLKNIFVLKISEFGSIDWVATHHGYTATSVIETMDNEIVISGKTNNLNDHFYFHRDLKELLFISKIDKYGSVKFTEYFDTGSTVFGSYKSYVTETNNGDFILVGTIDVSYKNEENEIRWTSNVLILCLTNTGKIRWKKELGGKAQDFPEKIIRTKNNEFAIVGGTISEESLIEGVEKKGNCFFLLIDENGQTLEYNTFDFKQDKVTCYVTFYDLVESPQGNFTIVGSYQGPTDLDITGWSAFIAKLNSRGKLIKSISFGDDMDIKLCGIVNTNKNGFLCTGGSDWHQKYGYYNLQLMKMKEIYFLHFYFDEDQV